MKIKKTDLVLAPGVCDPFPTFLMEAMNYGVPCVVSANDGMSEIVEHGKTELVIPQPNPDLLASKITYLLKDSSALIAMPQNVRHKIKTQLNWEMSLER
ncbi:hypothetical protein BZZ01_31670 [Nostocales cyanobacterium HT-58-2]|nr:hypothetical protein BZZ01_31670 [Nostocales cyanobacterium HT-58-2]